MDMHFIRTHKRAVLIALVCCMLAGAWGLYYLRTSQSEFARGVRAAVKSYLRKTAFQGRPDLAKGLNIQKETVYVDGIVASMPASLDGHDVKVVYEVPDGLKFCDYANGFSVFLPPDMLPDFSHSPKYVSFQSPKGKVVLSREWTYDSNVSGYVEHYFFRFVLSEAWRAENNVELLENVKTDRYERLTVRLNDYSGPFDTYTYLIFKTGTKSFFFAMMKYPSGDPVASALPDRVLESFTYFNPEGIAKYATDCHPVLPDSWTAETREVYKKLAAATDITWGIFTKDVTGQGIRSTIPEIERKIDHKFGIILAYTGLDGGFPTEFMETCCEEGRLVELTLQATESNNTALFARSPWLQLYRTGDDERIRQFARDARAFGKPFLFRLNNEMNSDWVSYGGVVNLLDPDIYVENWRTVYRIFQEEGVNNAIWIWNPHDRDYPPNSWNGQVAYYPGNEYVHMFGITGYNNGTYYQDVTGESWREFAEIYDRIDAEFSGLFGSFPWIITEFSSSSIGGDKAKWIDGMFENIGKYKNIKAAVWFSYADYDPKDNKTVSRPYWLDETEETVAAFKRGLARQGEMTP